MPGLAAGPEIFENLTLDKDLFEFHYLEWLEPIGIQESMANYAMRISDEIKHKNPVLIGVSFGGILVQEIRKYIDVKKVIIVSSVKSNQEFPRRFKLAGKSKIYKLFPTSIVSNFEDYSKFFMGKTLEKKAKLYKKYLSVRGELYLKWSIHNVIHWKQFDYNTDLVHIHGTKDQVFPIKYIKNCIEIENGDHSMIITKAKKISVIIQSSLTC